jgi:cell division protein FtsZ
MPVLLKVAREAGALTLCFATIPFSFEGAAKVRTAETTVAEVRELADALIVVPNDRLYDAVGVAGLAEASAKADDVLCCGVCSVWKMLSSPGYIRLDFAKLKRVVQNSGGCCTFGHGAGAGEGRAERAVADLLEGPLLEKGRVLASAATVLVSIAGGSDLTLREVGAVMDAVAGKTGSECNVEMGTVLDEALDDRLEVTVLASDQRLEADRHQPAAERPAAEPVAEPPARGGRRQKKQQAVREYQTNLRFDSFAKGRFKDVDPTILDGEDLDTPTYIRRGLSIEK